MVEGRSTQALEAFAQALVAHGGRTEQITLISMDMSPAYQSGASRFFPQAQIVFDRFHLMQVAGQALDKVLHRKSVCSIGWQRDLEVQSNLQVRPRTQFWEDFRP